MLDRLVGSELQANLGSARIGRKIIVLEQTDSTNDAILKVATADSNDVQIDEHKVAGVLVEMRAQKNAPHLAIAGIGVNVNQSREDFPKELQSRAISLAMALGKQVDRQKFAIALLRKLDRTYRELFG